MKSAVTIIVDAFRKRAYKTHQSQRWVQEARTCLRVIGVRCEGDACGEIGGRDDTAVGAREVALDNGFHFHWTEDGERIFCPRCAAACPACRSRRRGGSGRGPRSRSAATTPSAGRSGDATRVRSTPASSRGGTASTHTSPATTRASSAGAARPPVRTARPWWRRLNHRAPRSRGSSRCAARGARIPSGSPARRPSPAACSAPTASRSTRRWRDGHQPSGAALVEDERASH